MDAANETRPTDYGACAYQANLSYFIEQGLEEQVGIRQTCMWGLDEFMPPVNTVEPYNIAFNTEPVTLQITGCLECMNIAYTYEGSPGVTAGTGQPVNTSKAYACALCRHPNWITTELMATDCFECVFNNNVYNGWGCGYCYEANFLAGVNNVVEDCTTCVQDNPYQDKAQAQQIASLVDVVSLLPARPAAAAAPVASAGGGPATERPALGATRAASARGPSRRGGLPARVGDTSLRRSFVLSIPVARGANWFLAGGGRRMDEEEATAAAAERIAAAAEDGTSLPVRLATDVVRFLYGGTGRREPADGGVVSVSLLNAKPAVGGIGVEPRGGGVLRVLFTVASDAVADTVVRWRHELRRCVDSTAVFDVLSDREEAQHQALWPAFLAAKVAGKRAQFHRARLVVDGERVPAPAC
ncbi:hypothetical protein FOA52_014046 [Chlamydomonas sp. UWO 241]|nr:hypothetical protein FOA52_014046 [Chlamydomonas sp. UWO 241]